MSGLRNILFQEYHMEMRHKCASNRIVWIVTLMGTLIYGKRLVSQPDEMDKLDGQLLARFYYHIFLLLVVSF